MPSNTGIYDDHSDNDSLSNELSPTDGYFHQRSHPHDVLVPDPSLQTMEADKAREARKEGEAGLASEASAVSRRQSLYTPSATPVRSRFEPEYEESIGAESTPLISSAPPAYSAATADSTYQSGPSSSVGSSAFGHRGYNTMIGAGRFTPRNEPESLGAPLLGRNGDEEEGWKDHVRDWLRWDFKLIGKCCMILVALALGVGFIADAAVGIHSDKYTNKPDTATPGTDTLAGHGPPSCPNGVYTGTYSHAFEESTNFTFLEFVEDVTSPSGGHLHPVRLSGHIDVRPSAQHLESGVRVEVIMHYSDPILLQETTFDHADDLFSILEPSHIPLSPGSSSNPCMYVEVAIWIAPRLALELLLVQSQTMSVTFHSDLSLNTEVLAIYAVAGDVSLPYVNDSSTVIDGRETLIKTVSGSIKGSFPLYDLLHISSVSGSIAVDVLPREAVPADPKPAKLKIEGISSSVHVKTPVLSEYWGAELLARIPDREYQGEISTVSGGITADLIHGSRTDLHSTSGSIHAKLSPYGPVDIKSAITAHARSGSINIDIFSSISHPDTPLRKLYGEYKYQTGGMHLRYPAEWEGELEGRTVTGSITISWPGMDIDTDNDGSGPLRWHTVHGKIGKGEGKLVFDGFTGSANIEGGRTRTWHGLGGGNWNETDPPAIDAPLPVEPDLIVPLPRWSE